MRASGLFGRIAVVALLVMAAGLFAGARPVVAFKDFRCPIGYWAQPIGIMGGVFRCERLATGAGSAPLGGAVGVIDREIALYLVNLQVRVFDFDFARDNYLGVGTGVSRPDLR